jgi:hypothetical protein
MVTCFVIQPFDAGKFDGRYKDTFKPAIEAAGFEAYRVDKDPSVSIPIEQIEKGIREAIVCLADQIRRAGLLSSEYSCQRIWPQQ